MSWIIGLEQNSHFLHHLYSECVVTNADIDFSHGDRDYISHLNSPV